MKVSDEFLEYILDMLSFVGEIDTTKMFGGVLLKVGDTQLGILIGDALYFKVVDKDLQEQLKNEGSKQFSYKRKDKKEEIVIKNWWSAPDSAMDDSEKLVKIAEKALNAQS